MRQERNRTLDNQVLEALVYHTGAFLFVLYLHDLGKKPELVPAPIATIHGSFAHVNNTTIDHEFTAPGASKIRCFLNFLVYS